MPRICVRCGRRLNDDEHHVLVDDDGEAIKRWTMVNRGKGRMGLQRVRVYECRVSLIATSPATGKILRPAHPQRIKELDTRYVHNDRLKPGGDLHQ